MFNLPANLNIFLTAFPPCCLADRTGRVSGEKWRQMWKRSRASFTSPSSGFNTSRITSSWLAPHNPFYGALKIWMVHVLYCGPRAIGFHILTVKKPYNTPTLKKIFLPFQGTPKSTPHGPFWVLPLLQLVRPFNFNFPFIFFSLSFLLRISLFFSFPFSYLFP